MDYLANYIKKNKPTISQVIDEFPSLYMTHYQGIERLVDNVSERRNMKPYVLVLHGMTGCGKSTYAMNYAYKKYSKDQIYVYDSLGSDRVEWWQNYNGQECVIIEDFVPDMISRQRFLRLTDRFNVQVPIKGGSRRFLAKEIIITSNFAPSSWYPGITKDKLATVLRRIDLCFKISMLITGYKTTYVDGKPYERPVPLINDEGEPQYEWVPDTENMCPSETKEYTEWLAELNQNNDYVLKTPDLSFFNTLIDVVSESGIGSDVPCTLDTVGLPYFDDEEERCDILRSFLLPGTPNDEFEAIEPPEEALFFDFFSE